MDNIVETDIAVAEYQFSIQPQNVDFQSKLTLASLVNILLTTGGYNADENGFGIRKINEMNSSWVLLRLAVEMNSFPLQYESISVETWIESIGRSTSIRNFRIRNKKSEIIGYAYSMWAMIDLNTRRALDLQLLEGIQAFATNIKLDIEKPIKLETIDGEPVDRLKVKYSDIDINQHTNTMSYVKWLTDTFSLETFKQNSIKRFEINFSNEILFGAEVSIFANKIDNSDYRFEIRADDKSSCKARIVFEK